MQANKQNHEITKKITINLVLLIVFFILSLLAAYFYNKALPIIYSTKAQLRLDSSEKSLQQNFIQDIEAEISKDEFIDKIQSLIGNKIYQTISQTQIFKTNENGIVSIEASYINSKHLFEYIEIFTTQIEKRLTSLHKNSHTKKIQTINQKITSLDKNINSIESQIEEINSKKSQAKEIKTIKEKIFNREQEKNELVELELNLIQLQEIINLQENELYKVPETVIVTEKIQHTNSNKEIEQQLIAEQNRLSFLYRTYKDKHPKIIACKENINKLKNSLIITKNTKQKVVTNPKYSNLQKELEKNKINLENLKQKYNDLSNSKRKAETTNNDTNAVNSNNNDKLDKLIYQANTYKNLRHAALGELEIQKIKQKDFSYKIQIILPNKNQFHITGINPNTSYFIAIAISFIFAAFMLIPYSINLFSSKRQIRQAITNDKPKNNNSQIIINTTPTLESNNNDKNNEIEIIQTDLNNTNINEKSSNSDFSNNSTLIEKNEKYFDQLPLDSNTLKAQKEILEKDPLFAISNLDNDLTSRYKQIANKLQIEMSKLGARVLIPVSCKPQIGKTTWIANISAILAQSGYTVLMIDCNQANPNLHTFFNLNNQIGLVDVLNGENIVKATQKTSIKDLYLLTIGNTIKYPVNATYIDNLEVIIKAAKRRADIIFIDSPAINQDISLNAIEDSKVSLIYLNTNSDSDEERKRISDNLGKFRFCGYVKL